MKTGAYIRKIKQNKNKTLKKEFNKRIRMKTIEDSCNIETIKKVNKKKTLGAEDDRQFTT